MSFSLPRLAVLVAVCLVSLAGLSGAQAGGLPAHPPLPPDRPNFGPAKADVAPEAAAPAAVEAPVEAALPPPRPAAPQPEVAPVAEAARPTSATEPPLPGEEDIKGFDLAEQAGLADLVRKYAHRHNVPVALMHRIIMRESRYQPHLVHRTFFGLMQIAPGTARGMGYHGSPRGLLDAETNLAYATPYLANAWRLSGGDYDTAVRLYASGYYNTAKRQHMLSEMRTADSPAFALNPSAIDPMAAAPAPPRPQNPFEAIFGSGN